MLPFPEKDFFTRVPVLRFVLPPLTVPSYQEPPQRVTGAYPYATSTRYFTLFT